MTPIIDTLRAALLGKQVDPDRLLAAVLWCMLLLAVFYFLSVKAFQRRNSE